MLCSKHFLIIRAVAQRQELPSIAHLRGKRSCRCWVHPCRWQWPWRAALGHEPGFCEQDGEDWAPTAGKAQWGTVAKAEFFSCHLRDYATVRTFPARLVLPCTGLKWLFASLTSPTWLWNSQGQDCISRLAHSGHTVHGCRVSEWIILSANQLSPAATMRVWVPMMTLKMAEVDGCESQGGN